MCGNVSGCIRRGRVSRHHRCVCFVSTRTCFSLFLFFFELSGPPIAQTNEQLAREARGDDDDDDMDDDEMAVR